MIDSLFFDQGAKSELQRSEVDLRHAREVLTHHENCERGAALLGESAYGTWYDAWKRYSQAMKLAHERFIVSTEERLKETYTAKCVEAAKTRQLQVSAKNEAMGQGDAWMTAQDPGFINDDWDLSVNGAYSRRAKEYARDAETGIVESDARDAETGIVESDEETMSPVRDGRRSQSQQLTPMTSRNNGRRARQAPEDGSSAQPESEVGDVQEAEDSEEEPVQRKRMAGDKSAAAAQAKKRPPIVNSSNSADAGQQVESSKGKSGSAKKTTSNQASATGKRKATSASPARASPNKRERREIPSSDEEEEEETEPEPEDDQEEEEEEMPMSKRAKHPTIKAAEIHKIAAAAIKASSASGSSEPPRSTGSRSAGGRASTGGGKSSSTTTKDDGKRKSTGEGTSSSTTASEPVQEVIDDEVHMFVEKIMNSRMNDGEFEYYVHFKGMSKKDDDWVFANDMTHDAAAVVEFHTKYPNKPCSRQRRAALKKILANKSKRR